MSFSGLLNGYTPTFKEMIDEDMFFAYTKQLEEEGYGEDFNRDELVKKMMDISNKCQNFITLFTLVKEIDHMNLFKNGFAEPVFKDLELDKETKKARVKEIEEKVKIRNEGFSKHLAELNVIRNRIFGYNNG